MTTRKKTTSKKGAKKRRSRRSAPVPKKQWEMPVGFSADGIGHATLRHVVDPDVPTMQLSDLTLEQRAGMR